MKKLTFSILLTIITIIAYGQEINEPEFSNRPYLIVENKLNNLAKEKATMKAGMTNGLLSWVLKNENSNVVLQKELPRIIIKVDSGVDPSDIFTLFLAKQKRKKRIISTGQKLGGNPKDVSANTIDISFTKIRENIYEIRINQELNKGEYVFYPIDEGSEVTIFQPKPINVYSFSIE